MSEQFPNSFLPPLCLGNLSYSSPFLFFCRAFSLPVHYVISSVDSQHLLSGFPGWASPILSKTSFPLVQDAAERNYFHGLFPRRFLCDFPPVYVIFIYLISHFQSISYSQSALLSLSFLTPNSLISFHKNQLLTGGHLQHTQFSPAPKPFLWSGLTSTLSLLYPHPNLPTYFLSSLNLLEQSYSCSPVLKTTLIFKTHSIFLFKKISMINPFLILSFPMSSRTLLH